MTEQWRIPQGLCQCCVDIEALCPKHSDVGGDGKHQVCNIGMACLRLDAQRRESASGRQHALGGCLSAGCCTMHCSWEVVGYECILHNVCYAATHWQTFCITRQHLCCLPHPPGLSHQPPASSPGCWHPSASAAALRPPALDIQQLARPAAPSCACESGMSRRWEGAQLRREPFG